MDGLLGLTVGFVLLTFSLAIFAFRAEREIQRLKKRARFLQQRLEVVEKFNGLGMTNTDIHALK